MSYSAFRVLKEALTGHKGWQPQWRSPEPQDAYDYVIIGGGGHGLATAYYLAKEFSGARIAVLERAGLVGAMLGETPRSSDRTTSWMAMNHFTSFR